MFKVYEKASASIHGATLPSSYQAGIFVLPRGSGQVEEGAVVVQ